MATTEQHEIDPAAGADSSDSEFAPPLDALLLDAAPAVSPRRDWRLILAVVALGAITASTFTNALHDALVVDDTSFPPQPEAVSVASILQLFREDTWAAARVASGVYRPLALALLQLESLVFGMHLRAYHLVIVAAHVAVTLMVFALLRELLQQWTPAEHAAERQEPWSAWLAALAFGVHPIHTEAVNSIFNGAEVLATLGVVIALWMIATRNRRAALATWDAVSVAYFAALLCKESSVTLPVLALLILLPAAPADHENRWQRVLPLAWLAIPLGIAVGLRYAAIGLTGATATQSVSAAHAMGVGWVGRLELFVTSLRDFWRMIVWPHPLRASYDDYTASGVANAIGILLLVAGAAIAMRRRAPAVSVGIAFFYVALLPSSRLLSHLGIVVTLAERYVYLPSVGAALAVGGVLDLVTGRWRPVRWAISLPLCLLLAYVTFGRNAQWSSDVALWEANVEAAPHDSDGWKWLTAAYLNAGRIADAATICDREAVQHPSNSGLQLNCGLIYLSRGRRDEAEALYRRVAATAGGTAAHLPLARLLVASGRAAEADAEYEAARTAEGDPVRKQTIRGEQLRRLHRDRLAEAEAAYQTALDIDPRYLPAQTGLKLVQQTRGSTR